MSTLAVIQVILEWRHLSVFSYLSDDDLVALSHACRVEEIGAGRVFLRQGEDSPELAIVVEGEASLYQLLPSRKHLKVHYAKPGRSVDLRAVLLNTPWHYHAKMQIPGKILWVPKSLLKEKLMSHPHEYTYLKLITTEPALQAFTRDFKYHEDIETKDIQEFILAFERKEFSGGSVLIEQDKNVTEVFLVTEGRVLQRQLLDENVQNPVTLREISGPRLVGTMGLTKSHAVCLTRFEALGHVVAWGVPVKAYLRFVKKYPFL